MRRVALRCALSVAGVLCASSSSLAQSDLGSATSDSATSCTGSTAPKADYGIRFRFTAGDFVREPERPQWIHFLTEPVVVDVSETGPGAQALQPGDVIVAVDGILITTQRGSLGFWFPAGASVRLHVIRRGRPLVVAVEPGVECAAPGSS